jgi:predicted DNA-binding WGR domain protein
MKTVDATAVLLAAEELMSKNGSTTTLDVKNRLRNNGYMAVQAEVSRFMDDLARTESWTYAQQNSFRVYRLGPDTNETFDMYLEKDNDFWEISVKGLEQTVSEGKKGSVGTFFHKSLVSNRQAIRHAKKLVDEKKQMGFNIQVSQLLPMTLRKKFGKYLEQKPKICTLSFYNVEMTEKSPADFYTSEGKVSGYLIQSKSGGYQFTWENNFSKILLLLSEENLDLNKADFQNRRTTGEKIKSKESLSNEGFSISTYDKVELNAEQQIESCKTERKNLYEVKFEFESGEKTILSKFDLHFDNEFLPITQKILTNSN